MYKTRYNFILTHRYKVFVYEETNLILSLCFPLHLTFIIKFADTERTYQYSR